MAYVIRIHPAPGEAAGVYYHHTNKATHRRPRRYAYSGIAQAKRWATREAAERNARAMYDHAGVTPWAIEETT